MMEELKAAFAGREEMTFRELCAEMNCYSHKEVDWLRGHAYDLARLGGALLHASTILRWTDIPCERGNVWIG